MLRFEHGRQASANAAGIFMHYPDTDIARHVKFINSVVEDKDRDPFTVGDHVSRSWQRCLITSGLKPSHIRPQTASKG